jgi:hypothetical protein
VRNDSFERIQIILPFLHQPRKLLPGSTSVRKDEPAAKAGPQGRGDVVKMFGKQIEKLIHYIRRAIFKSGEFQEAKHFPVRLGVFTDEVIEGVFAFNHQRSITEDLIK